MPINSVPSSRFFVRVNARTLKISMKAILSALDVNIHFEFNWNFDLINRCVRACVVVSFHQVFHRKIDVIHVCFTLGMCATYVYLYYTFDSSFFLPQMLNWFDSISKQTIQCHISCSVSINSPIKFSCKYPNSIVSKNKKWNWKFSKCLSLFVN